MNPCESYQAQLLEHLYGLLDPADCAPLHHHLEQCGACRAALARAELQQKLIAAAAKAQGFEAKETQLIARESPIPDVGVSPEVDKVAFSLPAGSVSDPITTNDATVIVRVVERDEVTPEEFAREKDAFREQLLQRQANELILIISKGHLRHRVGGYNGALLIDHNYAF